jgi:hypothetical protein
MTITHNVLTNYIAQVPTSRTYLSSTYVPVINAPTASSTLGMRSVCHFCLNIDLIIKLAFIDRSPTSLEESTYRPVFLTHVLSAPFWTEISVVSVTNIRSNFFKRRNFGAFLKLMNRRHVLRWRAAVFSPQIVWQNRQMTFRSWGAHMNIEQSRCAICEIEFWAVINTYSTAELMATK